MGDATNREIALDVRGLWAGYGSALWAVFAMAMLGAVAIGLLPRKKPGEPDST